MRALLGAVAVVALAAGACGGDDDGAPTATPAENGTAPAATEGTSPTAAASKTAPATAATAATAATSAFQGTMEPVAAASQATGTVTVKDVRIGTASQYDTIVFQFDGAVLPGYTVQYAGNVPSCPAAPSAPAPRAATPTASGTRGRGTPTPLPEPTEPPTPTPTPFGSVTGVAMIAVQLNPASTGEGLARTDFRGGQGSLAQATQVCDANGVVAWVVGVNKKGQFRVTTLANPPRLVIDIER